MKLAWIGSGKIVSEALHASEPIDTIENAAIFARRHSREKAETLAAQYRIREVYTDYQELLEQSEADTVYIGLVNSAHFDYAREALLHGKHVILEKPLTGFLNQAVELQRIAEERQLCIMEAVTVLHNAVFDQMKANLHRIRPICMFQANYSQYSSRYDSYLHGIVEPCFSPECYGGALFDINVYNIHYCAGLFGAPRKVKYYPNIGYNGIDTSGILVLEYDSFHAVCTGAKDADSPGFVCLQGENGFMRIDGKPNLASALTTVIADQTAEVRGKDAAGAMVRNAVTEMYTAPESYHRMTREFMEFADVIDRKDLKTAAAWMNESVMVMKILEEARLSAGIQFPS